jgi:hypothetical protein
MIRQNGSTAGRNWFAELVSKSMLLYGNVIGMLTFSRTTNQIHYKVKFI